MERKRDLSCHIIHLWIGKNNIHIMKYITHKNKPKNTKNQGYALLFTIIVISIVSLMVYGIINSTYKQLILSSLATDSQTAFYKADTGAECALYIDLIYDKGGNTGPTRCDIQGLVYPTWNGTDYRADASYIVRSSFTESGDSSPCFEYDVNKTNTNPINVTIKVRGYNKCLQKFSYKTVERSLKIDYQR